MMDREVYANAPVVLVACEVKFPTTATISPGQQRRLKEALSSRFPLVKPVTRQTLTVSNGAPPEISEETVPRYTTRDRTSAVTIGAESLVVETTKYGRYEDFRDAVESALATVIDVNRPDGFERVGLRYIDEIRTPNADGHALGWATWIDGSAIGPAGLSEELGFPVRDWQGLVRFDPAEDRTVVLRYGPRDGYAVDPRGSLRRAGKVPEPGPYFLLDIDSFWETSGDIPEFEGPALIALLDLLHAPVRSLFESLITEGLREDVLRHA